MRIHSPQRKNVQCCKSVLLLKEFVSLNESKSFFIVKDHKKRQFLTSKFLVLSTSNKKLEPGYRFYLNLFER